MSSEARPQEQPTFTRSGLLLHVGHFVVFAALILLWEVSITYFNVPSFILPTPINLAARAWEDLASGLVIHHFTVTLTEVVSGFAGAFVVAMLLGSAIALVPFVERIVYPYVLILQTIPKVALAPLFLIWFGYGVQTKAITAGLVAFLPILVTVVAGLKAVDPRRELLMRSLRANSLNKFMKLRLPNMLPHLFAGLETGIIFAVLGAVLGEFIGGSQGLGALIIARQAAIDVAGVFSAIFYLSMMGLGLSALIRFAKTRFVFWQSN